MTPLKRQWTSSSMIITKPSMVPSRLLAPLLTQYQSLQEKHRRCGKNLEKSKEWLECKRFDLLHLWVKSIQFKEMSRILETIDELQEHLRK
ncbi:hypothetical protein BASA81_017369 [Batrachochytrium salamandrivorans]|nr:hypothetical protein BASA81_017369 [Batrachochytrium salamandrivorans]